MPADGVDGPSVPVSVREDAEQREGHPAVTGISWLRAWCSHAYVECQQLLREDDAAVVETPDVAEALLERAMRGDARAHVGEHERLHARLLRHAGGAAGPGGAGGLAARLHRFLV